MPDKPIVPAFDKCTACAFASAKGPVNEPLPTSHTEVCCLHKFARQGQPPVCLKVDGTLTCDGLCEGCPSRLKFRQLQDLVPPLPDAQDAAQEGTTTVQAAVTPKKGAKISPRRRFGFKKLTIELRPPKFKKKLWFGTYEPEDVDRAKDAINYYMGNNEPYILPDSPLIFAEKKLGIEFRDLVPSCEQFVQVGAKKMPASVYFAREVKAVIKAVAGNKKKGAQRRQKNGTPKLRREATPEPVMSCASGLTSSSVMPCASDSALTSVDDMVWDTSNVAAYGANSEVNSELATVHSSVDDLVWDAPGDTSNVAAYGTSNVAAYGTSNVAAYGTSNVTAYGTSNVAAYGTSNVAAYGTSNVAAYGTSNVAAYGTSNVAAYGAISEANSELATEPPSDLPSSLCEMLAGQGEIPFEFEGEELFDETYWSTFFNSDSSSSEGGLGMMEDTAFWFLTAGPE